MECLGTAKHLTAGCKKDFAPHVQERAILAQDGVERSHELEDKHYGSLKAVCYAAVCGWDMYTYVKELALRNEDIPGQQCCHSQEAQNPIHRAGPVRHVCTCMNAVLGLDRQHCIHSMIQYWARQTEEDIQVKLSLQEVVHGNMPVPRFIHTDAEAHVQLTSFLQRGSSCLGAAARLIVCSYKHIRALWDGSSFHARCWALCRHMTCTVKLIWAWPETLALSCALQQRPAQGRQSAAPSGAGQRSPHEATSLQEEHAVMLHHMCPALLAFACRACTSYKALLIFQTI